MRELDRLSADERAVAVRGARRRIRNIIESDEYDYDAPVALERFAHEINEAGAAVWLRRRGIPERVIVQLAVSASAGIASNTNGSTAASPTASRRRSIVMISP